MTFDLFFLSVAFISRQLSVKVTTWRTSFCFFCFFKILIALCFVEITKWWTGFHWKLWKCILLKVENKTILFFLLTLNVNIYGQCVCAGGGGLKLEGYFFKCAFWLTCTRINIPRVLFPQWIWLIKNMWHSFNH